MKKHAHNTSVFTLENTFLNSCPENSEYCAIQRFYPSNVSLRTARETSNTISPRIKKFDKFKYPTKLVTFDEFQKICHSALIPKASNCEYITTLQCIMNPTLDILYRVIYVENKIPGSKVNEHDLFEISTARFSLVYGISDKITQADEEYKMKSTVNDMLEYKLKEQSNVVLKFIQRTINRKIESAMFEYIMDSKGLLYIVDLRIFSNSNKMQRIRSAVSKTRRQNTAETRPERTTELKYGLASSSK